MTSLSCNIASAKTQYSSIVLGSGCFWGAEKRFSQIEGVVDAVSGYADGRNIEPTYDAITQYKNRFNDDNFAEVVQVTFDPKKVTLTEILQNFFEGHDPTQVDGQGNDKGTQYRSTILYQTEQEKKIAEDVTAAYQKLLTQAGLGRITTKISKLDTFHKAEEYHQDYLVKNPSGYCPDHSTGVTFNTKEIVSIDNTPLLSGKHIVILEAPFCPYCEAFKEQVGNSYQGQIPMHYRESNQLEMLKLTTETWATPTIFFIEDGKEVFAHQGFMNAEDFYQVLGDFMLGKNSEAYKVAFENGTESRFCKQYDLFKNTGEGVFVDKLSGIALFDTKHRFNSDSGWLSFTEALPGTTVEIPDNSYGMKRTEVRTKDSNIHLGHVFDDGPDGKRRFCINATVLDFKPR